MANFCTKCGTKLTGGERFCPHCGTPDPTVEAKASSAGSGPADTQAPYTTPGTEADAIARSATNQASVAADVVKRAYRSLNLPAGDIDRETVQYTTLAALWLAACGTICGFMGLTELVSRHLVLGMMGVAAAVSYFMLWQKRDWNWFYGIAATGILSALGHLNNSSLWLGLGSGLGALFTYLIAGPFHFSKMRDAKAEGKAKRDHRTGRQVFVPMVVVSILGAFAFILFALKESSTIITGYKLLSLLVMTEDVRRLGMLGYGLLVAALMVFTLEIVYLVQSFRCSEHSLITGRIMGGMMAVVSVSYVMLMLTFIQTVLGAVDGVNNWMGESGLGYSLIDVEHNGFKILGSDVFFPIAATAAGIAQCLLPSTTKRHSSHVALTDE